MENDEISVLNKEARNHKVQKVQFEKMKQIWEEQVNSVSKTLDNTQKLIKWTQPLRGEVNHIIKMNLHLKSKNKTLKDQVKDLQDHFELIHEELEKKGLKMILVDEPIAQLIINEEETPQKPSVEIEYALEVSLHAKNQDFAAGYQFVKTVLK